MAGSDVQISFGADVSGVEAGVDQAKDALGGLDPTLQGLAEPVQAFQAAVAQAFGDTSASTAWAASVQASCAQATAASAATAASVQTHWKTSLDPLGASFAHTIDTLLQGSESFAQAFQRLGDQMLSRFIAWCVEMAERWAVKELAQTAASASGAAARASGQLAAQATGLAASAATATADIGDSAARAAAGAYAAIAAVPLVGPALAPAAAASALAAVLAFDGGLFSAEGGWGQVGSDGALTTLHQNEMVLPAAIATPLRSMLAGDAAAGGAGAGGQGGSGAGATSGEVHHHWNIQAIDARSFARLAADNPDAITGALTRAAQRLGVTQAVPPGERFRTMSDPYLPDPLADHDAGSGRRSGCLPAPARPKLRQPEGGDLVYADPHCGQRPPGAGVQLRRADLVVQGRL